MKLLNRTIALAAVVASLAAAANDVGKPTALDRYLRAADSSYRYQLVSTIPGTAHTAYVLEMTSQTWRSPAEVDRTAWKHWLTVIKPDTVKRSIGFLFIGGGNNASKPPDRADLWLRDMAVNTGSVTAELRMVPNQPLTFAGEKKPRSEDALIAYTWDKFLRGGDDQWPARLPMTKSAVRAMDTVTAFCAAPERGGVKVERFVVAGGSKRGWTTWTTAAVDSRVVAIVPMVIDLLNVIPSFEHHYAAYGFYAPAVKDYEDLRIMEWKDTPRYRELMRIEEPWEYRDRLTMPKYIVNSAGDQFFLPDSWQFYFDGLKGEKYLRYVPNTDHSLRGSDVRDTVAAYYESILTGRARPRFTWKIEKNGTIRVKTVDPPSEVKLWQATNPDKRDFRLMTIGQAYTATTLAAQGNGTYVASVPKPSKGWTAYFVELTYPSGGKHPLKFTTGLRVMPDTLPFKPPKYNSPPVSP